MEVVVLERKKNNELYNVKCEEISEETDGSMSMSASSLMLNVHDC